MRRFMKALSVVAVLVGAAHSGIAAEAIDCPLRDERYSIGSPLIDILLKPEAKAAIDSHLSGFLQALPKERFGTAAPTFSAILTLREVMGMAGAATNGLGAIDEALKALPVTDADRTARCARYDTAAVTLDVPKGKPRLLLFEKINGFRDGPSVDAAHTALSAMAERNGWAIVTTDKGGAITPENLRKFDAIIWNNISGDVLTVAQRQALKNYIEHGGGFAAVHGSGGDPVYFWDWYVDTLIGARFKAHPMNPQFQDAQVTIASSKNGIGQGLAPGWLMNDEWYSFSTNPRAGGADVIATLDEATYSPKGMGNQDLHMGDHPIAWTKCIGNGRSFYSAIGHRPETYSQPNNVKLLEQAIAWTAGLGATRCQAGREIVRR